jgi:hypothetical protein
MNDDSVRVNSKLEALRHEFDVFKKHFLVLNKKYSDSLATLSALTISAKGAALRAATAAQHALVATTRAYEAVTTAAAHSLILPLKQAADAAWAAAESASVCAAAVAQQAEEISVQAASQASHAASAAATAAAEAVTLSRKASDIVLSQGGLKPE